MWFDGSDPHRVTRRSANGFWLHVVAAPALVNTIALSLLESDTTAANIVLLCVLFLFAIVAIIIDRRSFLIAAIGYVVVVAHNDPDPRHRSASSWRVLGTHPRCSSALAAGVCPAAQASSLQLDRTVYD